MTKDQKDKESNTEREQERGIKPVNITGEMKAAYLNYAMSVITSRALPDARSETP